MPADGNSTGLIVMGGIVGIIAISVIAYYVARAMKGSMKLALSQGSVSSGEKITGSLTVMTKKPILCDRMYIALIGEREERRRRSSGDGTSTRWVEFYRDEADVVVEEQMRAGFQETYQFELDTPSEAQVMSGAQAISKISDTLDDGTMKTMVQGLGNIASIGGIGGGRKRWKVISRLETKGVDLAASQKIHVSLKQTG